jgi:hypothetical protein
MLLTVKSVFVAEVVAFSTKARSGAVMEMLFVPPVRSARDMSGALTVTLALPFVLAFEMVRVICVVVPVTFRMEAFAPEVEYVGATWSICPEKVRVALAETFFVGEMST